MDRMVKLRTTTRSIFTRNLNRLREEISAETLNKDAIHITMAIIERKASELLELDKKILESMLDEEGADVEQETVTAEEYQRKYLDIQIRVSKILMATEENNTVGGANVSSSLENSGNLGNGRRRFKLPKLELRKFGGEIKDWVQFWSQFRKIDEDSDLAPEDNFQYLIQATTEDSRARELVESFPPTGENYVKAIESLKARFGREDLLVEFYVRELLKLVLQNARSSPHKGMASMCGLHDKLESQLRALETLGVTTDRCAAMLYPLVESCMPEEFLRAWQRNTSLSEVTESPQRLAKMMDFLRSEVQNEERISLAMAGFNLKAGEKIPRSKTHKTECFNLERETPSATELLATNHTNENSCLFCGKQHSSAECFKAQEMDSSERIRIVKAKGGCFACLKPGHLSKKCKARIKCILCGKRHVVLMCSQLPKKAYKEAAKTTDAEETVLKQREDQNLTSLEGFPRVFLQTLVVKLKGNGDEYHARALIDTGSQRSYILDQIATKLNYQPIREEVITHSLFGGVRTHAQRHQCYKIHLESLDNKYRCNFDALDQPTICGDVAHVGKGPWVDELKELNIYISDSLKGSGPIQILIGADVAGKLMTGRRHVLRCGLVAVETLLGWTLMGKVPNCIPREEGAATVITSMYIHDATIENLWKLDIIGISDPIERKTKNENELMVKESFKETLTTHADGRYEVKLPWKEGHPLLPSNRLIAERRLRLTSKKLDATGLTKTYDEVLKAWQREGIVEKVPSEEIGDHGHYLPHRPIINESSKTTPVRPIFDASAHEKNLPSLNQCLEKGPNLLELIPTLLLRFRLRKIGVIADIEKAFLQISLHKDDRDFLRFLWWDDPTEKKTICVYRHTRVVFGVTSSPFLLGGVIENHLERALDNPSYDTEVIKRLKDSFYVDNVVTSVDNQEELVLFESQAKKVMMEGRFNLRGWEHSYEKTSDQNDSTTVVLGVCWNKEQDTLKVKFDRHKLEDDMTITKRVILSTVHKIYDPIGILCPILLNPKLLLQRTWELKIDWDTEVRDDIKQEFLQWYQELSLIDEMCIPRWIRITDNEQGSFELHTFCDASQNAYAAVVYIRVTTTESTEVYLLAAKARVATLKKTTIPRLELLAATVGARLYSFVKESLESVLFKTYFWIDSSTVLAWITRKGRWSVFVENRVREITCLTDPTDWRHVPTDKNPADLPSRGCTVKQLLGSRWWEGPAWLRNPSNEWPHSELILEEDNIKSERRKASRTANKKAISGDVHEESVQNGINALITAACEPKDNSWISHRFSNYDSVIRLMGWVKRFISNCRSPKHLRTTGELDCTEQNAAEKTVVRLIQEESFDGEKDDRLRSLNTCQDEQGILRVKTSIINREDTDDFRRPMVLPSDHVVVERLIMTHHQKHCHAGVQILLSLLREQFWILGGRKALRRVLSKCVKCRRFNGKNLQVNPAPLPVDRVKEASVFEVTGIDLAGPLYLRGKEKAWICLFTCAVYRAVHLELIMSLSTESFLQAFRRFVARRGRPSIIYSDNGTNFVGADNLFARIDWEQIAKYSTVQRIVWKFNPPTSAWWGGWWERLIGLVKQLLRRILGKACLTYQEMTTVLCDCEAVVNSRPLTYVSSDTSDLVPLTPAFFLQEVREVGVPDCDHLETINLNKRMRYIQGLRNSLRNRFRQEYLGQLVQKQKTGRNLQTIKVGDIVIIGSDNTRRLSWPLGRIVKLFPGTDGCVRLVHVKTMNGEYLRPIQRVYPLEVTDEEKEKQFRCQSDVEEGPPDTSQERRTRSGRLVKPTVRYPQIK